MSYSAHVKYKPEGRRIERPGNFGGADQPAPPGTVGLAVKETPGEWTADPLRVAR